MIEPKNAAGWGFFPVPKMPEHSMNRENENATRQKRTHPSGAALPRFRRHTS